MIATYDYTISMVDYSFKTFVTFSFRSKIYISVKNKPSKLTVKNITTYLQWCTTIKSLDTGNEYFKANKTR